MNYEKLKPVIRQFLTEKKSKSELYDDNYKERQKRKAFYQSYTREKLLHMKEEDFYEYISQLWSMLIWGNKQYIVDKLIQDNGFGHLKEHLAALLYGEERIEKRWDVFLKAVKGLGPATMSELLTYVDPDKYIIFNKNTITCFTYLEIEGMPKYNYQYTGKKYAEVCAIAKEISEMLRKNGAQEWDMLAVDYFMWDELLPYAEKKIPERRQTEVKIMPGAIVDAVWEAKIGNMGKAIYVFEVQSKGSIDSLILNLKKAQSNAAVQAVVAVADEEQLTKIIRESKGVIDEKSLRTWEAEDVLAVHDALVRAHESINKLELVPKSF